jgi:hypothetical protein
MRVSVNASFYLKEAPKNHPGIKSENWKEDISEEV